MAHAKFWKLGISLGYSLFVAGAYSAMWHVETNHAQTKVTDGLWPVILNHWPDIWLRYHGHLPEFGYSKYLIITLLEHFGIILGKFCFAIHGILVWRLAKIWTMTWPNSPDMPL